MYKAIETHIRHYTWRKGGKTSIQVFRRKEKMSRHNHSCSMLINVSIDNKIHQNTSKYNRHNIESNSSTNTFHFAHIRTKVSEKFFEFYLNKKNPMVRIRTTDKEEKSKSQWHGKRKADLFFLLVRKIHFTIYIE